MLGVNELRLKKRKIDAQSELRQKVRKFEEEYGKSIEVAGKQVYKIKDRFFEVSEPILSEYWEDSIYFEGEEESIDLNHKHYNSSGAIVLREIKPTILENGEFGVKLAKNPSILTKMGIYDCKDDEIVEDICEDSFVITSNRFDEKRCLKEIATGDVLVRKQYQRCNIFYDRAKLEFVITENGDKEKVTVEEVVAEVERRRLVNRDLKEYGITFSQAKSIEGKLRQHEREKEME